MSEEDLVSSPNAITTLKTEEESKTTKGYHRVLTPTLSSSPPRSRSQSVGSIHREALLFFERHKLFQPEPEAASLLPGIISEDTENPFKSGIKETTDESSDISSFSKSPSPAHYSDVQGSSSDERNTQIGAGGYSLFGNQLEIPQQRARSKSDNLTLLVRQESKKKERLAETQAFSIEKASSSCRSNSTNGQEVSPQRNRSIRGRSHSQPSQVIFSCSTEESRGESYINSGENRKGSKKYSWLEHIQFRAQYQHYRTNDYASVVNSASSLDKADIQSDVGGGQTFQVSWFWFYSSTES
jgi:hypothetical protein